MQSTLRNLFYRMTSLSLLWAGHRGYVWLLYAIWSKIYDFTLRLDPDYRENARIMVNTVVKKGDRVLDVGTGTGLLATFASPIASELVGLDYSGAMLSKAISNIARRKLGNVSLRWGDAKTLPFVEGFFDAVVSSFMLAHFARSERADVLKEMNRVLVQGGRLGLFQVCGELYPLFSTRQEMETYLDEANFVNVRFEEARNAFRVVYGEKPVLS